MTDIRYAVVVIIQHECGSIAELIDALQGSTDIVGAHEIGTKEDETTLVLVYEGGDGSEDAIEVLEPLLEEVPQVRGWIEDDEVEVTTYDTLKPLAEIYAEMSDKYKEVRAFDGDSEDEDETDGEDA